jgi:regulator of protease activity HflC (stomatin/prohibitin superfamily)
MLDGLFRAIADFMRELTPWVLIEPWEQALRVRLGKHVKKLSPGIHIKIPYIDVVHKKSSRYRTALCAPQTLTTKDGKTVVCSVAIGYALHDIQKLFDTIYDVNATLTQTVASYVADAVATTLSHELRAATISDDLTAQLANEFEKFGLKEITIRIQDFAFIRAFRLIQDGRWQQDVGLSTYPNGE